MLGISVAVGALLVLAVFPAATSAVRLERPAVLASADPTCSTGGSPRNPGYDPVTHEMYIPNQGNPGVANITVLNETCHRVGTIKLPSGAEPFSAAFNPRSNDMYVTDYALNQVYIISGTKIVQTLTGFDGPKGITYDPYGTSMAIVNSGNDQVYEGIDGTTAFDELFATGTDPYGIVADPTCLCDIVTNTGNDNVTIYDDYTGFLYSEPVGVSPRGIAYDPASGQTYVANSGDNTISVFVDGFPGPTMYGFDDPYGVAWDQSTLTIWVTNYGNGKVYEIGGPDGTSIVKKLTTASDSFPLGLAYDEFNNDMYVTGFDTNVAYVLS